MTKRNGIREAKQHELHMTQLLGQMLQQRSYPPPSSSPYDYNYDDDTFLSAMLPDTFTLLKSVHHNATMLPVFLLKIRHENSNTALTLANF